eukprot:7346214-Pyramimonas_sp.AAC.1
MSGDGGTLDIANIHLDPGFPHLHLQFRQGRLSERLQPRDVATTAFAGGSKCYAAGEGRLQPSGRLQGVGAHSFA